MLLKCHNFEMHQLNISWILLSWIRYSTLLTILRKIFGGARLATGKKGLALHTNGQDQYVDFGYQGDTCLGSFVSCTHGWVTTFWIQMENDDFGVIVDTGAQINEGVEIKRMYDTLYASLRNDSKQWFLSCKISTDQGWIHIVVTWRPCYGAKLYIDGELASTHIIPPLKALDPVTDCPRFVLGARFNYENLFEMTLDELRVWDTTMSDEEVLALYTVDAGLI